MKPFTTLLLLTLGAAARSAASNASKCGMKNGAIQDAIQDFCANTHLTVPSKYARDGIKVSSAHISIRGRCNSPQWVPQEYCISQFEALCGGSYGGFGIAHYGDDGCQEFRIIHHYVPDAIVPVDQ